MFETHTVFDTPEIAKAAIALQRAQQAVVDALRGLAPGVATQMREMITHGFNVLRDETRPEDDNLVPGRMVEYFDTLTASLIPNTEFFDAPREKLASLFTPAAADIQIEMIEQDRKIIENQQNPAPQAAASLPVRRIALAQVVSHIELMLPALDHMPAGTLVTNGDAGTKITKEQALVLQYNNKSQYNKMLGQTGTPRLETRFKKALEQLKNRVDAAQRLGGSAPCRGQT